MASWVDRNLMTSAGAKLSTSRKMFEGFLLSSFFILRIFTRYKRWDAISNRLRMKIKLDAPTTYM